MADTAHASRVDYLLVDADNHYYEPYDCFTRFIEPEFRDRAVHVVRDDKGLGRLYVGDRGMSFMRVIQTDYTGAPGSRIPFLRGEADGSILPSEVIAPRDFPEMVRRDARLALMDRQGIEATLMFPSLGVVVEHDIHDDVPALYANLRAFNRWVEEDWGFGADGRIFGVPLLSLVDRDQAVAELDRVLARGARAVALRPGPVYGRSPADPYFDPFWARVTEAGVPLVLHAGDSGYNEMVSTLWSEPAHPSIQRMSPFQWFIGTGERPIVDTLAALVLHNLFGRFPSLRVLSIENGSHWVPSLFHGMHHAVRMGRNGTWLGGRLEDDPRDVFGEHVYVNPYPEEDPLELVELIGADRVLFGSDYPHAEGFADPVEFADALKGLPPSDVRKVMRDNCVSVLGLDGTGRAEVAS